MMIRQKIATLAVCVIAGLGLVSTQAQAQTVPRGEKAGVVEWGVWIDPDGCMHWVADGGVEGYQVNRLNPKNGKPVCLKKNTCYVADADTHFATDSAHLTNRAKAKLREVFTQSDVFGYAVYGHTDARASHSYNQRLSERRAAAVANYGRSVGAVIERQIGFGETRPVATNHTAAGMRQNRRVEVVCYRW